MVTNNCYDCSGGGTPAKHRPFNVHPKEWLAGVAIFLCLLYLRVAHFPQGSYLLWFGDTELFEFHETPNDVITALRAFCNMDIAMRCGDKDLYGCQQAYGAAITNQIGIIPCPQHSISDKGKKLNRTVKKYRNASIVDCSLQLQVTSIDELSKVQFITLDDVALHGSTEVNKLSAAVSDGHIHPKDDALATLMASLLNNLHLTSFLNKVYTVDDREAILENNLNEIIDLFTPSEPSSIERGRFDPAPAIGTSKATRNGITDIVWSRNEILDLADLVVKHQVLLHRNENLRSSIGFDRFGGTDLATPKRVSPLMVQRVMHKMVSSHPKEGNQIDLAPRLRSGLVSTPERALYNHPASTLWMSPSRDDCSGALAVLALVTYKPKVKHAYELFLDDPWMDQCMKSNFENETLVTKICQRAMKQAPTKLYQLGAYPESIDFIFITYAFMIGANLAGLLMLLDACILLERYVDKFDRGKRQLELELNDPFLRASLEHQALSLPEDQRQLLFNRLEMKLKNWDNYDAASKHAKSWVHLNDPFLLASLERKAFSLQEEQRRLLFSGYEMKLQHWDSYDAASKLALKGVLQFRDMMVFIVTVSVLVGLFLSICHIKSWAAYLENLMVSIGMWTLSYAIPTKYTEVSNAATKTQ